MSHSVMYHVISLFVTYIYVKIICRVMDFADGEGAQGKEHDLASLCNCGRLARIFFVQTISYNFLHAHNCCMDITIRCIYGSKAKPNRIRRAEIWQDVHLVNQRLIDAQSLNVSK